LQDFDHACPIKEARAHDLARPTKEARALDVEGINSKNTIIVYILEGINPVEGSRSCTIRIDFTSRINFIALRKKDKIKAKKANRAKSRD
jgi:hypothetical protein